MSAFTRYVCAAGAIPRLYRARFHELGSRPDFEAIRPAVEFIQGWTGRWELESLFLLAGTATKRECVVEVGSFCGRSTVALAFGAEGNGATVVSVDPHTGDISFDEDQLVRLSSECVLRYNLALMRMQDVVDIRVTTSSSAARAFEGDPIGLLFIDGWHTADAVYEDAHVWTPHLAESGIVVFDDWENSEVWSGVQRSMSAGLLPALVGSVGRHLIFGARDRLKGILPRLRDLSLAAAPFRLPWRTLPGRERRPLID